VQSYYASLITSIKQLCENSNIIEVLLKPPDKQSEFSETTPMTILREATKDFVGPGENANDHEKNFLRAKSRAY